MILPTVHLNGTSRGELHDQWLGVLRELRSVREFLVAARPHGRDYYPQDTPQTGSTYNLAADEHVLRLEAVDKLIKDAYIMLEHTAKQLNR